MKKFKEIVQIAGTKYEIRDENIWKYYLEFKQKAEQPIYLRNKREIVGIKKDRFMKR